MDRHGLPVSWPVGLRLEVEGAGDGLRDGGWSGEVSSLGLESILISSVGDGVEDSIRAGVGI